MQNRATSAIEAATSTIIGLGVSMVLTLYALPLFGVYANFSQSVRVTALFTIASLVRQYAVRRMFNVLAKHMSLS